MTWGRKHFSGDSSCFKTALIRIDINWLTTYAFAALLKDKTEATWGEKHSSGDYDDSWSVKTALIEADHIISTDHAIAAVLDDMTVGMMWGDERSTSD